MSEKPMPNIGADLQRIHRVVTRGLSVAQENCQTFASNGFPDEATREGFWKYCLGLEAIALGHHLAEDELFFPYLRERLPATDFDSLEAEHQQMLATLEKMRQARESGSLEALGTALSEMNALWHPHIEQEETQFSPEIAAEVMTVQEHISLAQQAAVFSQQHTNPAPLAIPFLFYNLEGDDRAHFMRVMPPEITQQLVPVVWKDEWAPMKPFLLD